MQASLHSAVSDRASPRLVFASSDEAMEWLDEMSIRLAKRIPDQQTRLDFLTTVQYEAKRAGLDPQLVLGLIEVESAFRKYAVSPAGARGYMQVMPFWSQLIGTTEHNLFHLRTNLRYGCVILRHYLDIERGNLVTGAGPLQRQPEQEEQLCRQSDGRLANALGLAGRASHAGCTPATADAVRRRVSIRRHAARARAGSWGGVPNSRSSVIDRSSWIPPVSRTSWRSKVASASACSSCERNTNSW